MRHNIKTAVKKSQIPSADIRQLQECADLLEQGLSFHRAGRLQEALQFYRKVLKINAKQFDALQLSATIHAQIGNHSEALMLFDDALKINQKNANVFKNNHGTCSKSGQVPKQYPRRGQDLRVIGKN